MSKRKVLIKEQQAMDIEALQNLLNDPNITAETKQGIQGLIANAQKFAQQQSPPAAPVDSSAAPTTEKLTPTAAPVAAQSTSEPQVQRAQNPYTTQYKGPSIVDFLKQSGLASDKASRAKMAVDLGIVKKPEDYKFTADQNTQMLNALKQKAQKFDTLDKGFQQQSTAPKQQPLNVGNVSIGNPNPTQQPSPPSSTQQPKPKVDVKIPKNMQFNPEKKGEGEENEEGSKKFQYFGLNKTTVQEKNNIAKFLRHLSEKNYSSAHKYLKAIVESKIKRNILQRIGNI